MTDPELKWIRDLHSVPTDKKFALIDGSIVAWPKTFRPSVPGYTLYQIQSGECLNWKPPLLGIHLDTFEWDPKKAGKSGVPIGVSIRNVGGPPKVGFLRGPFFGGLAKREGKRWVVRLADNTFNP